MIAGIGIDMVHISRITAMLEKDEDHVFIRKTFTEHEKRSAPETGHLKRRAEYFAGRFAAKEAVFKALPPAADMPVDLRRIEILRAEDGRPYVNTEGYLKPVLESAGISVIHLSITHEKDYAAAFAVAER